MLASEYHVRPWEHRLLTVSAFSQMEHQIWVQIQETQKQG